MSNACQMLASEFQRNVTRVTTPGCRQCSNHTGSLPHGHTRSLDTQSRIGTMVTGNRTSCYQHIPYTFRKHCPQWNSSYPVFLMEDKTGRTFTGIVLVHHPIRPSKCIVVNVACQVILLCYGLLTYHPIGFTYSNFTGTLHYFHLFQSLLFPDKRQDTFAGLYPSPIRLRSCFRSGIVGQRNVTTRTATFANEPSYPYMYVSRQKLAFLYGYLVSMDHFVRIKLQPFG